MSVRHHLHSTQTFPEWWDVMNLWNMLYGSTVMWNLYDDYWEAKADRFVRTYNQISPWHEKIGFDEMPDHKFLTPDRRVQPTWFSSGWTIIVNFDPAKPYRAEDDIMVSPSSYTLIELM